VCYRHFLFCEVRRRYAFLFFSLLLFYLDSEKSRLLFFPFIFFLVRGRETGFGSFSQSCQLRKGRKFLLRRVKGFTSFPPLPFFLFFILGVRIGEARWMISPLPFFVFFFRKDNGIEDGGFLFSFLCQLAPLRERYSIFFLLCQTVMRAEELPLLFFHFLCLWKSYGMYLPLPFFFVSRPRLFTPFLFFPPLFGSRRK